MNQLLNSIVTWNKDRDNNKYEPALEFEMLQEELSEYVHAYIKTVNDYVGFDIHESTEEQYEDNKDKIQEYIDTDEFLEDWRVNQLDALCDIIFVAVGSIGKLLKQDTSSVEQALWEVIEANEKKSKDKNEKGKITKPEGFVGPEERLRSIIKEKYND